MKNLIKKNQLMITALAIMLAIAGYLQFAGKNLDEEYLSADVAGSGEIRETYTVNDVDELLGLTEEELDIGSEDIESLDTDLDVITENYLDEDMIVSQAETEGADPVSGEAFANAGDEAAAPQEGEVPGEAVFTSTGGVTLLSEAKLVKEQVRARNKETLLEIINSEGLTQEQKQAAVDSMVNMTSIAERETEAELLLEAKGFSDVVVSINDQAVDVVVNALELTDVQRAQIEDIVKRKTQVGAENIIISTVVE